MYRQTILLMTYYTYVSVLVILTQFHIDQIMDLHVLIPLPSDYVWHCITRISSEMRVFFFS